MTITTDNKMSYSFSSLASTMLMLLSLNGYTQAADHSAVAPRNNINAYLGIFEWNINYERNIIQRPRALSNLRFGFGYGQFLTAGEGNYINPAFAYLIGERNSHVEIDLGLKYMLTNSIDDPGFSEVCIPDIFIGYRYEKRSGGFSLRIGLNYPTLINLGIGYKF